MADIFCGKVIEIHIFTSVVSKYMFLGSVNMSVFPNICMPLTEDVQGKLQL